MRTPYRISQAQLRETFAELGRCGNGKRECQVLWLSPWAEPALITEVAHPRHTATAVSFDLDDEWLRHFWADLHARGMGVRVQVHTHPGAAFHSRIDDEWPLVQTEGFLSLVLPRFAQGAMGFDGAYIAQIDSAGHWAGVRVEDHIEVAP